jgi:cation diffusion facilitator CzcD-associated flavoprotein CzcO
VYDEAAGEWEIESEDGRRFRARFLITAIGPLSAPTMPNIPGVDAFRGEAITRAGGRTSRSASSENASA